MSTQLHTAAISGKDISVNDKSWQGDGWQVIDMPGTIGTDLSDGITSSSTVTPSPKAPMTHSELPLAQSSSEREAELMSLIRDLNECNDVLLDKVTQLEEALDKSQTALQAEIDRTHGPAVSESRTLSDRHIAQMVTELEVSTQSLKRYQVLNETLQAELTTNKDRVAQLDQDCTRLQQQCADQGQRLLQAETSTRDLRARLQRQQRYTLQFKAALEKCLNVSSGAQAAESGFISGAAAVAPAVSMPKVDNIAPWTSHEPAARLDPQLESLIRGERPTPESVTEFAAQDLSSSMPSSPLSVDAETEAQLWRDLARVIEIPDEKNLYATDAADDTELMEMTEDSAPPASVTTPATAPAPVVSASPPAETAPEPYLPAMAFPEATPAPVVYPLRAQKRVASMAAVDLPMFPRLKQPQS
ncbi:MAG: hypothetical protein AAFU71_01260 [Cyanobacteria bacterium J06632_22]